jgi:hypothetical protein
MNLSITSFNISIFYHLISYKSQALKFIARSSIDNQITYVIIILK